MSIFKPCKDKPCRDCPWRRVSAPGWLGSEADAQEWIERAHGETDVECHITEGHQCAGIAIYRANVCKVVKDRDTRILNPDREAVFALPQQFKDHHDIGPKPKPVFIAESLGATLEYAEGLGFTYDDDADLDEAESDALDFIRAKGYRVIDPESEDYFGDEDSIKKVGKP